MALILAIEPDRRQTSKVAAIVKNRLHAEIVSGDTTEHAVAALGGRVPDLILTSQLLSRKDEAALADWLRQSDEAGAHVQTLVIPVLSGSGRDGDEGGGLLSRFTRGRSNDATTDGCDPDVFAAQIREYLERAAEERRHAALLQEDQEAAAAAAAAAGTTADSGSAPTAAYEPVFYEPTPAYESTPAYEPSAASLSQSETEPASWSPATDSSDNPEPAYFEVEAVLPADAAPVGATTEPEESDDDSWSEITLGDHEQVAENPGSAAYSLAEDDEDTSLELTSETIDLQRFVEELSNQASQSEPAPAQRGRSDDVLAEFEEALETIASDTPEPARPNGESEADSEVLTPLVGATAWPHLDSTVAKTPPAEASSLAPEPAGRTSAARPRSRKKSRVAAAPAEWSTFDPEQCGFTAVLAKLDKMAADGKAEKSGR
jgi:hypothetical protein